MGANMGILYGNICQLERGQKLKGEIDDFGLGGGGGAKI